MFMKTIRKISSGFIVLCLLILCTSCQPPPAKHQNSIPINQSFSQAFKNFKEPPLSSKSRPLWFWNGPLSKEQTLNILSQAKEKGYYGLGILPSHGMTPPYMSPEFLMHYKYALEIADSLGMKMCLYDEFYFPSGTAGGNLAQTYPEALSKRLDKEEFLFKGPGQLSQAIEDDGFIGVVAMELSSLERLDLTRFVNQGHLKSSLPEGDWRVMLFSVHPDNSNGINHVDYLDSAAVAKFINLTYDKFFDAFPEHFGTTIDFAFYDEPCMRWVKDGRTWTGSFNSKFQESFGFSPLIYYPAMWYDIGPETAAARNLLFGFRAELFASGFAGTLNKWCNEHGIQLTGHVDQEEVLNPTSICGDLIKSFKYQDIACVDQIAHFGRASKIYKLISSAAINYGRPLAASETYGAIGTMPVENLYKEAMDQFAKGINLMEPHAVWYQDQADIPPNLSPANSKYGPYLEEYNQYIGRLQLLLQGGQHLARIAMLYPIASLQAAYSFDSGDPGLGGKTAGETDYLDLGEILSLNLKTDFTYLHPETLDERCNLGDGTINLFNNSELSEYKVIIIPGSKTISWSNLQMIQQFYEKGGQVIATSVLPEFSAEKGKDEEVQSSIQEIFGSSALKSQSMTRARASSIWNTGGFLPAYVLDGNPKTAWRPSRGAPEGEWLELEFGNEIRTGHIELLGGGPEEYTFWKGWSEVQEDQTFGFRLIIKSGDEWKNIGSSQTGKNSEVHFPVQTINGLRVIIESGKVDKVSIPEILVYDPSGKIIDLNRVKFKKNSHPHGGKAYFIPAPNAEILRTVLNEALPIWDVRIDPLEDLENGNLTYIHKILDHKHIYFFANSSASTVEIPIQLDGAKKLSRWDPHKGLMESQPTERVSKGKAGQSRFILKLDPVRSVFFVETN